MAASIDATLWSLPLHDLQASRYSLSNAKLRISNLSLSLSSFFNKFTLSEGVSVIACRFSACAAKGHK